MPTVQDVIQKDAKPFDERAKDFSEKLKLLLAEYGVNIAAVLSTTPSSINAQLIVQDTWASSNESKPSGTSADVS